MKSNKKKRGINILLVIGLFFLIVFWLFFGKNGFLNLYRMEKQRERLLKRIYEIQMENRRIALEIERLKNDPRYIEKVARKELGLVKENEIIYQFKRDK